jgi:hypothetical protein
MGRTSSTIHAIALLVVGCTSGTEPELPADRFALAEIGGHPLPSRVGDHSWLADTIRFQPSGSWTRVQVLLLYGEGVPRDPVRWETDGFVTRQGDRIVLDFDCDPAALAQCVAPDTLRIEGNALVRHLNRYGATGGEDPEFRYAPIGPFF